MLYPEFENKLRQARHALNHATSENIVELCKQYLTLLAEYRGLLYELKGVSGIRQQPAPNSSPKDLANTRKEIRAAIETTTQERNRTQLILFSCTTVSAYEAVEIFNRRKYEGHGDWELRASGVKFRSGTGRDLMTIQEAVELAGLLRREDHVAQNAHQTSKKSQV